MPHGPNPDPSGGDDEDDEDDDGPSLDDIIDQSIEDGEQESIFQDKSLLDPNRAVERERIVGRREKIEKVAKAYSEFIRGGSPKNFMLWGASGTGKTLIAETVAEEIRERCRERDIKLGILSINCKNLPSRDRAMYKLFQAVLEDSGPISEQESTERAAARFGKPPGQVTPEDRKREGLQNVPRRGISTDEKYDRMCELINWRYDAVLFILDEIDNLRDPGESSKDEPAYSKLLYRLSRGATDEIEPAVGITATTNVPNVAEKFDSRSASSFGPEAVQFPPYDATQIKKILWKREDAFVGDGREDRGLTRPAVELAAAMAASDDGDARRAINLIRSAGEFADSEGMMRLTDEHVRRADREVTKDELNAYVRELTTHKQLALYAIALTAYHQERDLDMIPYSPSFQVYQFICDLRGADYRVQDSFNRYLKEFETTGIIGETVEKGRGKGKGTYKAGSIERDVPVLIETLHEGELKMVGGADIGDTEASRKEEIKAKVQKELEYFFD